MADQVVRWDDSAMRTSFANVCNVGCTREELTLNFGMKQAWDAAAGELTVHLSSRVVLHPGTAARLRDALRQAVDDYSARFGPLDVAPAPRPVTTLAESPRPGARLLQLVKELRAPYILGHSFKMLPGTLLGNRFLVTIAKRAIGPRPDETVQALCERLEMPPALRASLAETLPAANYVHVGFEESGGTLVYKVYLEFWTTWEEELEVKKRSEPFEGGFGFKWDPANARRSATTRYTCHPLIPVATVLQRAAAMADTPGSRTPLDLTRAMVEAAAARLPASKILYLEADEAENPRKSFDINVLQARLLLNDVYPQLAALGAHYGIDAEAFHALYTPIRNEVFSHVQGGVDREGREFTTIYHGSEEH